MKARCQNPKASQYRHYGGRGITVEPSWEAFEQFLADMGERPPGTTLGRLDNGKGYSRDNCAWQTDAEQASNKRSTVFLTHDGVTRSLADWARHLGMNHGTLATRYYRGYPVTKILAPKAVW